MTKRDGATRIADERKRQVEKEGWTPNHDDEHEENELAFAALCAAEIDRLLRKAQGEKR